MNETKVVVYRRSREGLGAMREMILGQALELFEIRYDTLKADLKTAHMIKHIDGLIAGCDVTCSLSMIGVVCTINNGIEQNELEQWVLKNLIDRELYLLSETWEIEKSNTILLSEFLDSFKLFRRISF